jgi:transcriptional regulator with XRE-family HTH domain
MTGESGRTPFAVYLQSLREQRRYSKSELARRADIDATYLGRIERGLLPPPRPKNLFRLAAALGLSEEERTQLLELSGRADATPLLWDERGSVAATVPSSAVLSPNAVSNTSRSEPVVWPDDDQIAMILEDMAKLQQQVARLLVAREDQMVAPPPPALQEAEVLASVGAILSPRPPITQESPRDVSGGDKTLRSRGEERGEIRELGGQEAVLQTMIEMISAVPQVVRSPGREVLLATHWIDDMFGAAPYLRGELWRALETALRRGWDVVHLMAIKDQWGQSTAWIRAMIGLLGTPGLYLPQYFPREAPRPLPYSFLLVPDIGAMQLIAEPPTDRIASALLYPAYPSAGSALGELFAMLRRQSQPLLRMHSRRAALASPDASAPNERVQEPGTRGAALVAAEGQQGERMSIWPDFPMPTIPPHCLERQACRRHGVQDMSDLPPPIHKLLEMERRRHALFRQGARSRRYRSICDRHVVERFLREGQYGIDAAPLAMATRDERVDHVRVLLALLHDTRYELALADASSEHLFQTGLMIKATDQGGSVFLVGWKLLGTERDLSVDSEITEPGVVNDFRRYFDNAWSQLPPHCKDKAQVIAWLEGQLNQLLSV